MGLADKVSNQATTSSGTTLKVHKGKSPYLQHKPAPSLYQSVPLPYIGVNLDVLRDQQEYVHRKLTSMKEGLHKYAPHVKVDLDLAKKIYSQWFCMERLRDDEKKEYRVSCDIILGDGVPLVFLDLQKRLYADVWETYGSLTEHYLKISLDE